MAIHLGFELPSEGVREDDCGEWATRWAVYDRASVEAAGYGPADALEDWAGWGESYSGPGRWFWSAPGAIWGRTRIIVRQSGGLDI